MRVVHVVVDSSKVMAYETRADRRQCMVWTIHSRPRASKRSRSSTNFFAEAAAKVERIPVWTAVEPRLEAVGVGGVVVERGVGTLSLEGRRRTDRAGGDGLALDGEDAQDERDKKSSTLKREEVNIKLKGERAGAYIKFKGSVVVALQQD